MPHTSHHCRRHLCNHCYLPPAKFSADPPNRRIGATAARFATGYFKQNAGKTTLLKVAARLRMLQNYNVQNVSQLLHNRVKSSKNYIFFFKLKKYLNYCQIYLYPVLHARPALFSTLRSRGEHDFCRNETRPGIEEINEGKQRRSDTGLSEENNCN
jgi:hypothetical protein